MAFEIDDLEAEIKGKKIIVVSNSPSDELTVEFIEVNGVPVELMEYLFWEEHNQRLKGHVPRY